MFLSVIISTSNRAQSLAAGLEALGRQSWAKDDFEVIVAENGGSDAGRELCDQAGDVLPNCRYIFDRRPGQLVGWHRALGVAAGGIVGTHLAVGRRWYRVLPAGTLGLGVLLLSMAVVPVLPRPSILPAAFALLTLAGAMGGMVLIPSEAFVQIRAADDRKGTVIASVNFVVFSGILVSGPAANALDRFLKPTWSIAVAGGLSLVVGYWLLRRLARLADEGAQ